MIFKNLKHADDHPAVKAVTKEHTAAAKELSALKKQINTLRREPFTEHTPSGRVDPGGAGRREAHIRRNNRKIAELMPRLDELKAKISQGQTELTQARRLTAREAADNVREHYRALVLTQFKARLQPLVALIVARAEADAIVHSLESAGHERHHLLLPRPQLAKVDDVIDRLHEEAKEYMESGWLKKSDLPDELLKAWNL